MQKIIILFTEDLYNELEYWYPLIRMKEAGAQVLTAGPQAKAQYKSKIGFPCISDIAFRDLDPDSSDALIIPGGYAPDRMRRSAEALEFVRAMDKAGKCVAFICHAGWVPISAGILSGRKCTSFSAIKDDMVNAGAAWSDAPVVVDRNLVSSRTPDDLPEFCKAILSLMGL